MINKLNNWLLIAGNGRNTGKTSLACLFIENIKSKTTVFAIKIAPHFHDLNGESHILFKQTGITISEEVEKEGLKDSSRFLKSGAQKVFYVQCEDEQLQVALDFLLSKIPQDAPVICESGGMRKLVAPGMFLICYHPENQNWKERLHDLLPLASKMIAFKNDQFDIDSDKIQFKNAAWQMGV